MGGRSLTAQNLLDTSERAGADLTNRVYRSGSTRSPNIFWITMDDLAGTEEVLRIDPRQLTLVGDQTSNLAPAELTY